MAVIVTGALAAVFVARRTEVGILNDYAMRLRQAYEQEAVLSRTDDLTGLANRREFYDQLQGQVEAQQSDGRLHVVFIDLDDFKAFNDRFGHAVGDEVLRQVAQHFRRRVAGRGTVGRIGGDEFAAFLTASSRTEASRLAQSFSRCRLSLEIAGGPSLVTADYGVSSYGQSVTSADALMAEADREMYRRRRQLRRRSA